MERFNMIPTMRWFGPSDGVSLPDIRQAGCRGVVTALHHIPNGAVWPMPEIENVRQQIEKHDMEWRVVESLPVSEEIKTQRGDFLQHIENYKQSIRNLASCGIKVITYNFMPILDWTRTDLSYLLASGAKALRFERQGLVIFDLFILQREGALEQYTQQEIQQARQAFEAMSDDQISQLQRNIIAGLPGSEGGYSIERFRAALDIYREVSADRLRENIVFFLKQIMPVAEQERVQMAIHPDDPPFEILGLPRVMSRQSDFDYLFEKVPSTSNGICFCTGSLGVIKENNLPEMLQRLGSRVFFLHLRNTKRNQAGDFFEADHLQGDTDMYAVVKQLVRLMRQQKREIPMRPDHGHQILDDLHKNPNPGYSGIGRLKGLAELRGLEYGIQCALNND